MYANAIYMFRNKTQTYLIYNYVNCEIKRKLIFYKLPSLAVM